MDDRISNLPETCVLSKSWRDLVSTRPNLSLAECYFRKDKEKFIDVLERSLQVYYDRKLCIEEFEVCMSKVNPGLVLLLEKWIPLVEVKKFRLSCSWVNSFGLPLAIFESESLQEINLKSCNLRPIGNNNHHLKTLILQDVCIEEETNFAKFLSIERLSLRRCKGLRTINMHDHHNLKRFELERVPGCSIEEIYLPSTIGYIDILGFPNWHHHRNYFPVLTFLKLSHVPLSNEWFNSFSQNFPCLEELGLFLCNGFDELRLSSRSIKKLHISMDDSTNKATIDIPNIIYFCYHANISQSIYINTTSSGEWNSQIHLSLDLDSSLWFLKLSEIVSAFSQSQISLGLFHCSDYHEHIGHLSDINSVCYGRSPVAMKSLDLIFDGLYYDLFFSDLVIGLFRFVRPREIKQNCCKKDEFLCRTLQMAGRSDDDEGMSFWQQDLEEVSLQVFDSDVDEEWHPVQGTINWSEFAAAFRQRRFLLKWRE